MKQKLFIIGAGGHGRVVLDAALQQSFYDVVGLVDDNLEPGTVVQGVKVITDRKGVQNVFETATRFIVAIGNNELRRQVFEEMKASFLPATVIHPSAVIATHAQVQEGSVVLAGAVINVNAVIGKNCIINSMSLIDHDTRIGDHTHIAQGTIVGSNVTIPESYVTELGGKYPSYQNY